jgi:thiamine-monophosphate kinase
LNLENYFISLFNSKQIGDDAALIDNCVYSKDAFFEDVHFKRSWMNCEAVAKKAMLVNISDAVAMNADPKYALLAVAMPKSMTKKEMQLLVKGFEDTARAYDIEIIGGDTVANTKLDITVTVISYARKPLMRKGVKKGYLFAYTGELGRSAKDLKKLFNLGKIHKKSKFVDIKLRADFIRRSERILAAGMDISDGLFSDLQKMTKVNRTGVRFMQAIPKDLGCSGEEYEMLVAFDPRHKKAIMRRAKQSRTPLTIFGVATRNRYTNRCKAHHF